MCDDGDRLVSLPAEWTDAVPEDPFVVVASGRAPFHLEGLLALVELVAALVAARSSPRTAPRSRRLARRQADYAARVSGILPLVGEGTGAGRANGSAARCAVRPVLAVCVCRAGEPPRRLSVRQKAHNLLDINRRGAAWLDGHVMARRRSWRRRGR